MTVDSPGPICKTTAPAMLQLDAELRKQIDEIIARYPVRRAAMLPILHLFQERFGSISDEVIQSVAEILEVPPAAVYGVISFYVLFKRPWEGRHVIWVCATLPCALAGAERLYDHLKEKLKVDETGTSPDRLFTLKKQECLAACDRAVCVQIDEDYYFNMDPGKIDRIVDELRAREKN